MRGFPSIPIAVAVTLIAAVGATPALARHYGGPTIEFSVGQFYPAQDYYQPSYYYPGDYDNARADWIARERWEQRHRWEEQRRWEYRRAQQHWQREQWEHRRWHGDDDDD